MLVLKRDMQTAVNNAATGSIISALDPAPLRVGEAPRINTDLLKDHLQDIFVKNFGTNYAGRVDVKVFSVQAEPPAVAVAGEAPVQASLLDFLSGSSGNEKNIRGRAVVVYEAKSTTK